MAEGAAGATALLARARNADLRAEARLAAAIDTFFIGEDGGLDERERRAIAAMLDRLVGGIAGEVVRHCARLLEDRGLVGLAQRLEAPAAGVFARLVEAGLVRDRELIRELVGRVRQEWLAEALPSGPAGDPDRPSLLPRLIDEGDGVVAGAAMALMLAESRRRLGEGRTDLPAELHHRLVWWTAAALRDALAGVAGAEIALLDRALAEAAQRSLTAHDEGERLEAAATRLAQALEPRPGELPYLLTEALADRRAALFVALLAHALGIDYAIARDMVLDSAADRLWLALRALELPRDTIAGIGVALCEADPHRDVDAFAEALDALTAIAPEAARAALAPLKLHPDFRAALLALARGPGR